MTEPSYAAQAGELARQIARCPGVPGVVRVVESHAGCAAAAEARTPGPYPAALTLGDCFSYALTRVEGGRLLFKGNDFAQTDIASAW